MTDAYKGYFRELLANNTSSPYDDTIDGCVLSQRVFVTEEG